MAGITSLPDGSVIVADATNQELRAFGPDGAFLKSFGRRGQGPGEYQLIALLASVGDTILVFESLPGQSRVTRVHASTGTTSRGPAILSEPPFRGSVVAMAGSGAALTTATGLRPFQAPPLGETRADTATFGVGGTPAVVWLPPMLNRTWVSYRQPEAVSGVAIVASRLSALPVTGSTQRLVWLGDNRTGELRGFDATGTQRATVRWPRAERPVDRASIRRYLDALLKEARPADSARSTAEHVLPSSGLAPRFQGIATSSTPELWVEEFQEDPWGSGRAWIFDETGRSVATVPLPPAARIRHVSGQVVVLTRRDDDGFERVLLYRVAR